MGSRSCASEAAVLLCAFCAAYPGAAQNAQPQTVPNVTFTSNRIAVDLPPDPLRLGEVNELTLHIRQGELLNLEVVQAQFRDAAHTVSDNVGRQDHATQVLQRPDGTKFIRLVPMALGDVELNLIAMFRDGAVDQSSVTLKVGPSNQPPAWIALARGGDPDSDADFFRIDLDAPRIQGEQDGRLRLFYQAYYPGIEGSIGLDPAWIKLSILQPANHVIDVDQKGRIKPLRRGDALLQVSFAGATRRACILVRAQHDMFDRGCKQMRAATSRTPPGPLNTTWSEDPDGLMSQWMSHGLEFFTDRLKVDAPDHPVQFGEPIEIPVEITSGEVRSVGYSQRRSDIDEPLVGGNDRVGKRESINALANTSKVEGYVKTVEVVPLAFGDEIIEVFAHFKDGGFSHRYFRLRVLPSSNGLRKIAVGDGVRARGRQLSAQLSYAQFRGGVDFPTLTGFKIEVEQSKDAPVVRVDPDGLVHELRNGKAVVVISVGSISSRYTLEVPSAWTRWQRWRDGLSQ